MLDQMLTPLKAYVEPTYAIETIAETVPMILVNYLLLHKYTYNNQYTIIHYPGVSLMTFKNNLGGAIYRDEYDTLDDIIISFFNSIQGYSIGSSMVSLKFPEEETLKFRTICNSFKSKAWNDIISEFIEAFSAFISSGKLYGDND